MTDGSIRVGSPREAEDDRQWYRLATSVLVLVVAGSVLAAPAGATGTAGPTIQNATAGTATAGGNVTVAVESGDATEIDLTGVPDNWTVATHRDDFGTYANQLDGGSRLVWLWSWTVSANVSATLSVPESAEPGTYDLEAVAYAGTTRGATRNVSVTVESGAGAGDGDRNGSSGLVGRYDADGNGEVSISELGAAAADYAVGELTIAELGTLAAAYATG